MDLEQIYVFPLNAPVTVDKRKAIEAIIEDKAKAADRQVTYKWLKRGDDKLLRAFIDPVTLEAVFHDDRVELFGAAPAWAKLLFTKSRRSEVKDLIEQTLIEIGLLKVPELQD